jgi:hypothetical protein
LDFPTALGPMTKDTVGQWNAGVRKVFPIVQFYAGELHSFGFLTLAGFLISRSGTDSGAADLAWVSIESKRAENHGFGG